MDDGAPPLLIHLCLAAGQTRPLRGAVLLPDGFSRRLSMSTEESRGSLSATATRWGNAKAEVRGAFGRTDIVSLKSS